MFMNKHIFLRSGYFYYRMAIPNDLKHLFPFREIKQSRSTDDKKMQSLKLLEYRTQHISILDSPPHKATHNKLRPPSKAEA